jgi:hypothetical protein
MYRPVVAEFSAARGVETHSSPAAILVDEATPSSFCDCPRIGVI